jgi:hypothetical protein
MNFLKPCEKGVRLDSWENYYQMKRQLVERQNMQEVDALYWLAQAYALPNGTSRLGNTTNHTRTYVVGTTFTHTHTDIMSTHNDHTLQYVVCSGFHAQLTEIRLQD